MNMNSTSVPLESSYIEHSASSLAPTEYLDSVTALIGSTQNTTASDSPNAHLHINRSKESYNDLQLEVEKVLDEFATGRSYSKFDEQNTITTYSSVGVISKPSGKSEITDPSHINTSKIRGVGKEISDMKVIQNKERNAITPSKTETTNVLDFHTKSPHNVSHTDENKKGFKTKPDNKEKEKVKQYSPKTHSVNKISDIGIHSLIMLPRPKYRKAKGSSVQIIKDDVATANKEWNVKLNPNTRTKTIFNDQIIIAVRPRTTRPTFPGKSRKIKLSIRKKDIKQTLTKPQSKQNLTESIASDSSATPDTHNTTTHSNAGGSINHLFKKAYTSSGSLTTQTVITVTSLYSSLQPTYESTPYVVSVTPTLHSSANVDNLPASSHMETSSNQNMSILVHSGLSIQPSSTTATSNNALHDEILPTMSMREDTVDVQRKATSTNLASSFSYVRTSIPSASIGIGGLELGLISSEVQLVPEITAYTPASIRRLQNATRSLSSSDYNVSTTTYNSIDALDATTTASIMSSDTELNNRITFSHYPDNSNPNSLVPVFSHQTSIISPSKSMQNYLEDDGIRGHSSFYQNRASTSSTYDPVFLRSSDVDISYKESANVVPTARDDSNVLSTNLYGYVHVNEELNNASMSESNIKPGNNELPATMILKSSASLTTQSVPTVTSLDSSMRSVYGSTQYVAFATPILHSSTDGVNFQASSYMEKSSHQDMSLFVDSASSIQPSSTTVTSNISLQDEILPTMIRREDAVNVQFEATSTNMVSSFSYVRSTIPSASMIIGGLEFGLFSSEEQIVPEITVYTPASIRQLQNASPSLLNSDYNMSTAIYKSTDALDARTSVSIMSSDTELNNKIVFPHNVDNSDPNSTFPVTSYRTYVISPSKSMQNYLEDAGTRSHSSFYQNSASTSSTYDPVFLRSSDADISYKESANVVPTARDDSNVVSTKVHGHVYVNKKLNNVSFSEINNMHSKNELPATMISKSSASLTTQSVITLTSLESSMQPIYESTRYVALATPILHSSFNVDNVPASSYMETSSNQNMIILVDSTSSIQPSSTTVTSNTALHVEISKNLSRREDIVNVQLETTSANLTASLSYVSTTIPSESIITSGLGFGLISSEVQFVPLMNTYTQARTTPLQNATHYMWNSDYNLTTDTSNSIDALYTITSASSMSTAADLHNRTVFAHDPDNSNPNFSFPIYSHGSSLIFPSQSMQSYIEDDGTRDNISFYQNISTSRIYDPNIHRSSTVNVPNKGYGIVAQTARDDSNVLSTNTYKHIMYVNENLNSVSFSVNKIVPSNIRLPAIMTAKSSDIELSMKDSKSSTRNDRSLLHTKQTNKPYENVIMSSYDTTAASDYISARDTVWRKIGLKETHQDDGEATRTVIYRTNLENVFSDSFDYKRFLSVDGSAPLLTESYSLIEHSLNINTDILTGISSRPPTLDIYMSSSVVASLQMYNESPLLSSLSVLSSIDGGNGTDHDSFASLVVDELAYRNTALNLVASTPTPSPVSYITTTEPSWNSEYNTLTGLTNSSSKHLRSNASRLMENYDLSTTDAHISDHMNIDFIEITTTVDAFSPDDSMTRLFETTSSIMVEVPLEGIYTCCHLLDCQTYWYCLVCPFFSLLPNATYLLVVFVFYVAIHFVRNSLTYIIYQFCYQDNFHICNKYMMSKSLHIAKQNRSTEGC